MKKIEKGFIFSPKVKYSLNKNIQDFPQESKSTIPLSHHRDLLWRLDTVTPNVLHLRSEAMTWRMANICPILVSYSSSNEIILSKPKTCSGENSFCQSEELSSLHLPRCFAFSNRWPSKSYFYVSCCCQWRRFLNISGMSPWEPHSTAARLSRPFQLCRSHSHTEYHGTDWYTHQRCELFTYRNVLLFMGSSCAMLDHLYIGGVQYRIITNAYHKSVTDAFMNYWYSK